MSRSLLSCPACKMPVPPREVLPKNLATKAVVDYHCPGCGTDTPFEKLVMVRDLSISRGGLGGQPTYGPPGQVIDLKWTSVGPNLYWHVPGEHFDYGKPTSIIVVEDIAAINTEAQWAAALAAGTGTAADFGATGIAPADYYGTNAVGAVSTFPTSTHEAYSGVPVFWAVRYRNAAGQLGPISVPRDSFYQPI